MDYILKENEFEKLYRYTGLVDIGGGCDRITTAWVIADEEPDVRLLESSDYFYRCHHGYIEKYNPSEHIKISALNFDSNKLRFWSDILKETNGEISSCFKWKWR